jgi:hypothetical protein
MSRQQDEQDLEVLLKGRHVMVTQVDGGVFYGMCNDISLWQGMVILHIKNRRFEFEYELLADHIKIQ